MLTIRPDRHPSVGPSSKIRVIPGFTVDDTPGVKRRFDRFGVPT